ncbi:MAG: ankyrin repeat domain-containing protein [Simkaniaceae bacterium]|nr:ankyrin repeat domain-containing protein [Simkaniaceae bacterium]
MAGNGESVGRPCESGARTDVCVAGDWAVFMYAVRVGHAETVRTLLLKSGVDPNELDGEGNRPLGLAVGGGHLEIVRELLYHGADTDGRNAKGRTPLIIAVEGGLEVTEELLGCGAGVNIPDAKGRTPFAIAVEGGHSDIIRALLKRGDVDVDTCDDEGRTPLMLVNKGDDAGEICNPILRRVVESRSVPLFQAVVKGDLQRTESLLRENTGARYTARTCEMARACAILGARWFVGRPDVARKYRQVMKVLENRLVTLKREQQVTSDSPIATSSPV